MELEEVDVNRRSRLRHFKKEMRGVKEVILRQREIIDGLRKINNEAVRSLNDRLDEEKYPTIKQKDLDDFESSLRDSATDDHVDSLPESEWKFPIVSQKDLENFQASMNGTKNDEGLKKSKWKFPLMTQQDLDDFENTINESNKEEIISEITDLIGHFSFATHFRKILSIQLMVQYTVQGYLNKKRLTDYPKFLEILYKATMKNSKDTDDFRKKLNKALRLSKNYVFGINHRKKGRQLKGVKEKAKSCAKNRLKDGEKLEMDSSIEGNDDSSIENTTHTIDHEMNSETCDSLITTVSQDLKEMDESNAEANSSTENLIEEVKNQQTNGSITEIDKPIENDVEILEDEEVNYTICTTITPSVSENLQEVDNANCLENVTNQQMSTENDIIDTSSSSLNQPQNIYATHQMCGNIYYAIAPSVSENLHEMQNVNSFENENNQQLNNDSEIIDHSNSIQSEPQNVFASQDISGNIYYTIAPSVNGNLQQSNSINYAGNIIDQQINSGFSGIQNQLPNHYRDQEMNGNIYYALTPFLNENLQKMSENNNLEIANSQQMNTDIYSALQYYAPNTYLGQEMSGNIYYALAPSVKQADYMTYSENAFNHQIHSGIFDSNHFNQSQPQNVYLDQGMNGNIYYTMAPSVTECLSEISNPNTITIDSENTTNQPIKSSEPDSNKYTKNRIEILKNEEVNFALFDELIPRANKNLQQKDEANTLGKTKEQQTNCSFTDFVKPLPKLVSIKTKQKKNRNYANTKPNVSKNVRETHKSGASSNYSIITRSTSAQRQLVTSNSSSQNRLQNEKNQDTNSNICDTKNSTASEDDIQNALEELLREL